MKLISNFQEGWMGGGGGVQNINLAWGQYGYFLKLHIRETLVDERPEHCCSLQALETFALFQIQDHSFSE